MFNLTMYTLIGIATWLILQPEADPGARILAVILASFCGMAIGVTWAEEDNSNKPKRKKTKNKRKYTTLSSDDEEGE